MKIFGIDIGNVIIENRGTTEEYRQAHYLSIPPVSGAFSALKKLGDIHPGNVYLISKCKKEVEIPILKWLHAYDFFTTTGISPDHVFFVRERKDKLDICRKLGVTNFIDDRLEILSHMVGIVPYLFLFKPNKQEILEFKDFLPQVTVINEWEEVIS